MERVLIVDDDADILKLLDYNLAKAGYSVQKASSGRAALDAVRSEPPDLIVLDLMLPDLDGMEVCRTLRQDAHYRRIPIIMLTARGDEIDRVVGFELGADDYVPKPFSPRELVLRVKSILRRSGRESSVVLGAGNIRIFPERRQCLVEGASVTLTAKEFDLLHELIKGGGNVLTRETLMDRVWGYHGDAESRTLDTHVRRLRDKLGAGGDYVETVRGIGYRIGGALSPE